MLVLFLLGWKAKMPMAQVEQIFCFTSQSWYQVVRRTTVAEQVVEFEVNEEFDIIVRTSAILSFTLPDFRIARLTSPTSPIR
jgi:hypothetical protein